MTHALLNLVRQVSATTGTGTVTLGAAVTGFLSAAQAGGVDGVTYSYAIEADYVGGVATSHETGIGVLGGSQTTLTRTVRNSTNSNALLNLAGEAQVIITLTVPNGGAVPAFAGKQCIPVPAGSMTPNTTDGAASSSVEMTTNKNMFVTLDFDSSTSESAQFSIPMPDSWNEGTITFRPIWSHPATVTNFGVVWELSAVAVSDGDAGDVAFGTGQTSTDTGGTTDDIYIGPESSAITVAGSPATGDFVMFKVSRLPANGSDTMAVDARLHGIKLFITTSASNDE